MDESSPFDHDSLMYKLMKYLYKIEEQMESAPIVWIIIDIVQFLTIVVSLLGEVIKTQYSLQGNGLFGNFLNIFFNYQRIYDWLVISGAVSAFIVILGLAVYLLIQYRKQIRNNRKNQVLTYCALTGTISMGLFQFFSQVMANNLINIFQGILNKDIEMKVNLIGFFFLNIGMMFFVCIFNSDRRIFRFSLVLVSLGLNILPFTLTCILIVVLSLYYQQMDKVRYKKLFYFLIIVTCVQCAFEMNDNTDYFLGSRFIYMGMSWIGVILYFIYYRKNFMQDCITEQNKYLVELYKKKIKKQDKKQDYLLADQYFTRYYEKQTEQLLIGQGKNGDSEFYLTESVQQWHEMDLKQRIIDKIKADRRENSNSISSKSEICYFQFLVQLKMNMVSLLKEVFQFMSEKKNDNIQTIYQINKLANKIEKQFNKEMPSTQDQILRVDCIIYLQKLFQQFYSRYATIVELLHDIFDSLFKNEGHIMQSTQEKLAHFTHQQKQLHKILLQIQIITPSKLQTKLYSLLSKLWDNYQKNSQNISLSSLQDHSFSSQSPAQKFAFSYVVISNKTIKYASIKFLSTYSYKQSYIVGENISMIFPSKFSLFIIELLEKNADKKIFHSQVPIINQKGIFQIVNATFYLLPEFKGQITYIILFKKLSQLETKSLFLFNSETLCIEGFNRRIINRFRFSLDKINIVLQSGAIQFSNLFVFNNQDKDFLTFTQKSVHNATSKLNRRMVQNTSHDKIKDQERSTSMKAMLKMDYLSDLKKSSGKNVTLEAEISFQINNISYKVIKVQDNSSEKIHQPTFFMERTQQLNIIREINERSANSLKKSTKYLKKKYQNEQFFCPIPNPYLPKILQQMNSFDVSGRMTNSMLIKIFFTIGLALFLGGMIGIRITASTLKSSITQFQREAQSLNRQYSFFMEGILHAYQIHHMESYPSQFKTYIENYYGLSSTEISQFYENQLKYLYQQKSQIIKKYQDAYFDFPILWDTKAVDVNIYAGLFDLKSTSNTTLSYDLVVFLLDSSAPMIKQMISRNFQLYSTLIKVLRPDGRYDDKIQKLQQTPEFTVLGTLILLILICAMLYYWLYQLRQTREQIISVYQFIEKKQIVAAKKKVSEIQDLIQILSNNKKSPTQQNNEISSRNDQFSTLSELNSANNLTPQKKVRKVDSIRSFQEESHFSVQNQNDRLLPLPGSTDDLYETRKISLRKKKLYSSKKLGILIQTLLKYPMYFILLLLNLGVIFFSYYALDEKSNSYIQAFGYFQKIRAANFQFRYLYAKSQQIAFYQSVMNATFKDTQPMIESQKKTHFDYEKPEGFMFSVDENLCSPANLINFTDPWFASYDCKSTDGHILTRDFSQAYQQYQRNLRQIANSSYQKLITDPVLTQIYFNSMYEYHIFKNYLNQLLETNFQINIEHMAEKTQQMFEYLFNFVILWTFIVLVFVFVVIFPKLQAEISTIISLIKIIPSQTLFNIKVASLIKKKDLLTKLSRL